jgi:dihydroorotate dehydrogenase
VFQGPGIAMQIARGLSERLRANGYQALSDAVGQSNTSTRPSRRGS